MGLLSLLGELLSKPVDRPGEVYSINSGDLFQITPVFDPWGQALRFKFDYAATTNIQEPSGSLSPDPSHIDRHTVNTEVQLANLEFREISRFETNSKLGIPDVRTGGIPILKDILIIGYCFPSTHKADVDSHKAAYRPDEAPFDPHKAVPNRAQIALIVWQTAGAVILRQPSLVFQISRL